MNRCQELHPPRTSVRRHYVLTSALDEREELRAVIISEEMGQVPGALLDIMEGITTTPLAGFEIDYSNP
jgi:hypothetical protein